MSSLGLEQQHKGNKYRIDIVSGLSASIRQTSLGRYTTDMLYTVQCFSASKVQP